MRPTKSAGICPWCGAANTPAASACAGCGHPFTFAAESVGDPLANSVAGAPVPPDSHSARAGLHEAGERLEPLLRDAAGVLSDRLARHSALPPAARRLQRHLDQLSRRPPPYVPAPAPPAAPLPLRVAWFVVAGIALTLLWVIVAWLALISVVGRTVAARMLERAPRLLILPMGHQQIPAWMALPIPYLAPYAAPMPLRSLSRVLYFLLVGWWASLIWLILSYLAVLSIVGIPLSYRMFAAAPVVAYLGEGSR